MIKRKTIVAVAAAVALLCAPLALVKADQPLINKVLIGVGGIAAVEAVAVPLNNFINQLMFSNSVANKDKTKVVPIIQVGSATFVGAAQVSGPQGQVDRTRAVAEYDAQWNRGVWQVRALVPIDQLNVTKGFKRVYGVGLNAVINAKL